MRFFPKCLAISLDISGGSECRDGAIVEKDRWIGADHLLLVLAMKCCWCNRGLYVSHQETDIGPEQAYGQVMMMATDGQPSHDQARANPVDHIAIGRFATFEVWGDLESLCIAEDNISPVTVDVLALGRFHLVV